MLNKNMYLGKLSRGNVKRNIATAQQPCTTKGTKNEREKERTYAVQQKRDESRIL
jgi:hypothetical protein